MLLDAKLLPERLTRFSDKSEKFVLGHAHNVDRLAFRFLRQCVSDLKLLRNEECLWELPLVVSTSLQKPMRLRIDWFGLFYWEKPGGKYEATCRVHQRDTIERSITLSPDRLTIDLKGDPSFVHLKLIRIEHDGGASTWSSAGLNYWETFGRDIGANDGPLRAHNASFLGAWSTGSVDVI